MCERTRSLSTRSVGSESAGHRAFPNKPDAQAGWFRLELRVGGAGFKSVSFTPCHKLIKPRVLASAERSGYCFLLGSREGSRGQPCRKHISAAPRGPALSRRLWPLASLAASLPRPPWETGWPLTIQLLGYVSVVPSTPHYQPLSSAPQVSCSTAETGSCDRSVTPGLLSLGREIHGSSELVAPRREPMYMTRSLALSTQARLRDRGSRQRAIPQIKEEAAANQQTQSLYPEVTCKQLRGRLVTGAGSPADALGPISGLYFQG